MLQLWRTFAADSASISSRAVRQISLTCSKGVSDSAALAEMLRGSVHCGQLPPSHPGTPAAGRRVTTGSLRVLQPQQDLRNSRMATAASLRLASAAALPATCHCSSCAPVAAWRQRPPPLPHGLAARAPRHISSMVRLWQAQPDSRQQAASATLGTWQQAPQCWPKGGRQPSARGMAAGPAAAGSRDAPGRERQNDAAPASGQQQRLAEPAASPFSQAAPTADTDGSTGSKSTSGTAAETADAGGGGLLRRREALQRTMSADLEDPQQDDKEAGSHGLGSRVSQALRGAFQTYYTVVFYNTIIRLLKLLGADQFFAWITPRLETGYARIAGVWYEFGDGRRRPYSLANNYDPDYSIPQYYDAREFPFGEVDLHSPPGYQPRIAHLLSLAMKLVYEHNDVIQDTIERGWGMECIAIIETASMEASEADDSSDSEGGWQPPAALAAIDDMMPDSGRSGDTKTKLKSESGEADTIPGSEGRKKTKRDIREGRQKEAMPSGEARRGETSFLPSSKAIVMRSDQATIIAFRGTEATNLLNWRTNITINMTRHKQLGGVHDGFYAALFHRPAGGGTSLFEDLVAELRSEGGDVEDGERRFEQPLYITGHSLGGAIASVFAQALAVKEPDLAAQVAAVYTFGEPRVGDSLFRDVFERAYGDRCFRVRNAGDIVPFLLPQWLGYRHRGKELFLTSFGDMKTDAKEIRRAALKENLGFPLLYVYKIGAGRLGRRRESWLRTLYRISFVFVLPGFVDHFPCEYERKTRASLEGRKVDT